MRLHWRKGAAVSRRAVHALLVPALAACADGDVDPLALRVEEGHFAGGGGVGLYYRAVGAGTDTVVVLHGQPATDMEYLARDIEPLARGRVLIFYDQRGGGRSELVDDPDRLTVEDHVQGLEALRRRFGLERLRLLGHSWGGGLAVLYAAKYPERVERMLLVAPMSPSRAPFARQSARDLRARLDSAMRAHLAALDRAQATADDPRAICREIVRIVLPGAYVADTGAAARFRGDFCAAPAGALRNRAVVRAALDRSRGDWDFRAEASRIAAPTLVVHGERDAVPLESSREWARLLPDARLLVIRDADHFPYAERPEQFIPAADRFLRGDWPRQAVTVR